MKKMFSKLKKKTSADNLRAVSAMQDQLRNTLRNDQNQAVFDKNPVRLGEIDADEAISKTMLIRTVEYEKMQLIGTFPTKKDKKTGVTGLNELSDGLFACVSPDKVDQKNEEISKFEYFDACLGSISKLHPEKPITYLVLGPQIEGEYANADAYRLNELNEEVWGNQSIRGHLHEFKSNRNGKDISIYHADVISIIDQKLEAEDLYRLVDIYSDTIAKGNPLVIHCTDGLDRAGGYILAMELMKNYDDVFIPGDAPATKKNIEAVHERLQNIRGGEFCTADEGRLYFASNLATLLKAQEVFLDLSSDNQDFQAVMDVRDECVNRFQKDFCQAEKFKIVKHVKQKRGLRRSGFFSKKLPETIGSYDRADMLDKLYAYAYTPKGKPRQKRHYFKDVETVFMHAHDQIEFHGEKDFEVTTQYMVDRLLGSFAKNTHAPSSDKSAISVLMLDLYAHNKDEFVNAVKNAEHLDELLSGKRVGANAPELGNMINDVVSAAQSAKLEK